MSTGYEMGIATTLKGSRTITVFEMEVLIDISWPTG
jgi:hypothetical protein